MPILQCAFNTCATCCGLAPTNEIVVRESDYTCKATDHTYVVSQQQQTTHSRTTKYKPKLPLCVAFAQTIDPTHAYALIQLTLANYNSQTTCKSTIHLLHAGNYPPSALPPPLSRSLCLIIRTLVAHTYTPSAFLRALTLSTSQPLSLSTSNLWISQPLRGSVQAPHFASLAREHTHVHAHAHAHARFHVYRYVHVLLACPASPSLWLAIVMSGWVNGVGQIKPQTRVIIGYSVVVHVPRADTNARTRMHRHTQMQTVVANDTTRSLAASCQPCTHTLSRTRFRSKSRTD